MLFKKIFLSILIIITLLFSVACEEVFTGKVTISTDALNMLVGETVTLTATSSLQKTIIWVSSDEGVASVTDDGVVTALKKGETTIIATDGGAMSSCFLSVTEGVEGYALTFHDEFDGTALNADYWSYQTGVQDVYGNSYGPMYWGNSELQYYTDGGNVVVSDGTLKIIAKKENAGDMEYTSARICTRNKFSQTYGYFEAKMKLPIGSGIWPAFWMMPEPLTDESSANEYGTWASCGEIDIMEMKGRLPYYIDTTIHFGGNWPSNASVGRTNKIETRADEWHVYALEWTEDYLSWIIDGKTVYTVKNDVYYSSESDSPSAPFDKPFYILFNLAVGGTYDVQGTAEFLQANDFTEAVMEVDYVRAYEKII